MSSNGNRDFNKLKDLHYEGRKIYFTEYRMTPAQWNSVYVGFVKSRKSFRGEDDQIKEEIDAEELHEWLLSSFVFDASNKFTFFYQDFARRSRTRTTRREITTNVVTSIQGRVIPIFLFDIDLEIPLKPFPVPPPIYPT